MEKKLFAPDTRYTVTLRDASGRLRAANIYVYRLYDGFMIVRMTEREGVLRKLRYEEVVRIVRTVAVAREDRFLVPEAVLAEAMWKDRETMERYSSGPGRGK
jgi:hypothetical protein